MRTALSRSTLIALAAAAALGSAACNTVAGAGEDIEDVGEAVGDAAEETEEAIDEDDGTPGTP
jgi:predicted small secreted protein